MILFRFFTVILLTICTASLALAEDSAAENVKKKEPPAWLIKQVLEGLDVVGPTEEQLKQIENLAIKTNDAMLLIKREASIDGELVKKRVEMAKKYRKKGKQIREHQVEIDAEAGLTDAQSKAMAKVDQLKVDFQVSSIRLLSDEQKGTLPEKFQWILKKIERDNAKLEAAE